MLILNRKTNEAIVIDGDIRIKVLRVRRGRAIIGVEAPTHVGVYREELLDDLRRNFSNETEEVMSR
ncbi:MAG: carbon storage regulator [Sedimentisphaerales bacterium]|nr:carbon storage regulator [Sedimentisphaerales bacterium]